MKPPVIFLAFANDRTPEGQYLRNLVTERKKILKALEPAQKAGLCEVVYEANSNLSDIKRIFQDPVYQGRIAIFHYGGHASGLELQLEEDSGKIQIVEGKSLGDFLIRKKSLKLVFLNGCSTAGQSRDLLSGGIPLVIGTASAINDSVATQLAVQFYEGIGRGLDVDEAWLDAESLLLSQHGRQNYLAFYRGIGKNANPTNFPWQLHQREGSKAILNWNLPNASNNPLFGLPEIPEYYYLKLPPAPFISLQSFQANHAGIFYGRGLEIRELYNKLQGPYPIILYYGATGVGKSSLLHAGLFPRMQDEYQIIYQRRHATEGLLGSLRAGLVREMEDELESSDLLSIWKKLEEKYQQPLIFILDQVEEAFTKPQTKTAEKISPEQEIGELLEQLAVLFDHPHKKVQGKIVLAYREEFHRMYW